MPEKNPNKITLMMVEGVNYIGRGYHFTIGSTAELSRKDAAYLLKRQINGKPQFALYDEDMPKVIEPEPEAAPTQMPTTRAGFIAGLKVWAVSFPQNATMPILKALWQKTAIRNGGLNAGDISAKELQPSKKKQSNVDIKVATLPGEEGAEGNVEL